MYIIIVGCGRLGSYLANNLSKKEQQVVIADKYAYAFNKLSEHFDGFKVEGNATEMSVLESMKASDADVFIAVTENDNINLMLAQIAQKHFAIKKVIARVNHPKRMSVFSVFGIDTICPTNIAGEKLLNSLDL
ncbi:MAG: TrkA family potassium uptake protein [bacterium]